MFLCAVLGRATVSLLYGSGYHTPLVLMLVLVLLRRLVLLGMRCDLCRRHLWRRGILRWHLLARLNLGLCNGGSSQSLMAALSATLGGIFDLGVRVALGSIC